jgi:hypothetical protein
MIEKLAELVPTFPGKANQTRCFLHIINLVAKSVIRQFDVEKGKADDALRLDEAELELRELAEGIDLEDLETQGDQDDDDDDDDGWVDERNALSITDREALDASVRPVKLVLVKVNKSESCINICTYLIPTAAKNCVCDYTLDDDLVASVV